MTIPERILIGLGIAVVLLVPIALYMPRDEEPPPENIPTESDWLTYTDDIASFRYPEWLDTTYLRATGWPPAVSVTTGPLSCEPRSTEMGETRTITIDGTNYCVTTLSEGAAGSVYTEYTYSAEWEGRVVSLSFTIRFTQCANYDEPDRSSCEAERAAFDVDTLAARMFATLTLN